MSLEDYAALKSAIASWMARGSLPTGVADECIDMAEAEFNRLFRNNELRDSDTFVTAANTEAATLPSNARVVISIEHTDNHYPRALVKKSKGQITDLNATSSVDRPLYWCEGTGATGILLARIPDAIYTLKATFWKSITPLDSSNTTNWLLTHHPDLYLLTALKKACVRFSDLTRKPLIENELNPLMADFLMEIEEMKIAQEGTGRVTIKGGVA